MNKLRRRQLVLSLKYSTIEACFSVPMLNLTLPSFPFVLAFAVQVLGWGPRAIGLMTALPYLYNLIQPVLLALLLTRLSPFRVLVLGFTLGALPWGVAGFMPWMGQSADLVFVGVLVVATLASCVASVAWSAAISEVVPPQISGRYFGRRNLIFGIWTLVIVFAAGWGVGRAGNTLAAFAFVFAAAGLARMIGLLFLSRMHFPPTVMERQPRSFSFADVRSVLRDGNYLRLVLFVGLWGLLVNAALPFYTVFLVNRLGMGIAEIVRLTTLASLGGLATLKAWGRLCDQFGNRPVLQICALIWAVTALAMWILAGPLWQWQLYAGYFVAGAVTAGFQLAQFNLMLKLAPAGQRAASVALFLAITSLLTAAGPLLGSRLLAGLPEVAGRFLGQPFTRFHILFALAAVGCLAATALAARVREPAEQPAENVWRAMRGMRAFNPMLSVQLVGELMLTPRGLLALGRRSWRSARRQIRGLGEVGGAIVEGSRDAMRKGFSSRD
jgi:Major Facilitator Superfamily